MSREFLFIIIETIIIVCYLMLSKNNDNTKTIADTTAKINLIIKYADAFVSWARQFMDNKSGPAKMNEVVAQLKMIANKNDIDMSETEIKAIAQKAYDNMVMKDKK